MIEVSGTCLHLNSSSCLVGLVRTPLAEPAWHCPLDGETRSPGIPPKSKCSLLRDHSCICQEEETRPFSQVLDKACYSKQRACMGSLFLYPFCPSNTLHILKAFLYLSGLYGTQTHVHTKARALTQSFSLLLLT